MKHNHITLSHLGLSNYYITESGKVYDVAAAKEIRKGKNRRFWLTDDNGKKRKYTLKVLYKAAYNKEFCIDTIRDFPKEQWKEIPQTDGKYFVSNCGRVKSHCGYYAIVL